MGTLKVTFDDSIDSALHSTVELWIAELCDWLEAQPRSTGLDKATPRFELLDIRVLRVGVSKGLRHLSKGTGWIRLLLCQDQPIHLLNPDGKELLPAPSHEIAFKATNCYILNQNFERTSSHTDEFEPELHYQMQLRYLSQFAPDVAKQYNKSQAAAKYKQQLQHKRQLKREAAKRRLKPVQQPQPSAVATRKPSYGEAPIFPPAPIAKREQVPLVSPCASEAEVIEQQRKFWADVAAGSHTNTAEANPG